MAKCECLTRASATGIGVWRCQNVATLGGLVGGGWTTTVRCDEHAPQLPRVSWMPLDIDLSPEALYEPRPGDALALREGA